MIDRGSISRHALADALEKALGREPAASLTVEITAELLREIIASLREE